MHDIENISLEDIPKVNEFLLRHGLNQISKRSLLYKGMLGQKNDKRVTGWKIINEYREIHGVLFSFTCDYYVGDSINKVSVASTWAVDKNSRGQSLELFRKFLKQKNIDIWIDGTATLPVSKILKGLKFNARCNSNFDLKYFWCLNYMLLIYFIMNKCGFKFFIKNSNKLRNTNNIENFYFSDDYDKIYKKIIQSNPHNLIANKSSKELNYRFRELLIDKKLFLIEYKINGEILGYLILQKIIFSNYFVKFLIIDYYYNNIDTLNFLIFKAKEFSKNQNGLVLEIYGLSNKIQNDIKKIPSFKTKLKSNPFWYKINRINEHKNLIWCPSLYDTDIYLNI